jgi:hypothetical protein
VRLKATYIRVVDREANPSSICTFALGVARKIMRVGLVEENGAAPEEKLSHRRADQLRMVPQCSSMHR